VGDHPAKKGLVGKARQTLFLGAFFVPFYQGFPSESTARNGESARRPLSRSGLAYFAVFPT
jgi:hypothetical protein